VILLGALSHTGKSKELAEVHERLADIMMEQEQFDQAAEDYKKSLALLAVRCYKC
jgi:hypothetical protein